MPKPPPPTKPKEAIQWFSERVPMTRAEVDELDEETRKRAFYVSGVAQLRMVSDVHKAITKALEEGTTLEEFRRDVGAKLTSAWGGEKPAQVETIFRNNVQAAYNAGRLEQFEGPLMKRFRPYRAFSVVLDARTTEAICRPLAKVVVPADSDFARSHIPPLHHRCRTGLMSLSEAQAGEEGITEKPPRTQVADGFGGDPRTPLKLDISDEPASLRRTFSHKQTRGPTRDGGE